MATMSNGYNFPVLLWMEQPSKAWIIVILYFSDCRTSCWLLLLHQQPCFQHSLQQVFYGSGINRKLFWIQKRQWLVWVVPVGWQPSNRLQQGWSFPSTLWRMEEQVTREIWSIWASSLTVHWTWTDYARSLPPRGYKRLWSIYFQIIVRIVCRISTIMKLQTSIGLQLRKDGSLWRWKMGVKHQWMYMRCQEWKLWTLWWETCWMEGWLVLAGLIGMGNPCLIFSLVNS